MAIHCHLCGIAIQGGTLQRREIPNSRTSSQSRGGHISASRRGWGAGSSSRVTNTYTYSLVPLCVACARSFDEAVRKKRRANILGTVVIIVAVCGYLIYRNSNSSPNEQTDRAEPVPKGKTEEVRKQVEAEKIMDKVEAKKEESKKPLTDSVEEERKRKESDAKVRLSAVKSLVSTGKPDVALKFAKELVRLHPDSPQAEEAEAIIKMLTDKN